MMAKYNDLLAAKVRGDVIKKSKTTVGEYAQKWLEATQHPENHATYRMYKRIVSLIKVYLPNIELKDLQELDIKTALNKIVDKQGKPLNRTREQFVMTLKQVLHQAKKEHYCRDNAAEDITVSYISEPRQPVTAAEWDYLTTSGLSNNDRLLSMLALWAGLRKSEVLALKAGDYDLSTNRIRISRAWTINKNNRSEIKDMPKTESGYREIKCPQPLRDLVETVIVGLDPDELLIRTIDGAMFTPKTFDLHWIHIRNEANIAAGGKNAHGTGELGKVVPRVQKIRLTIKYHELRHTYCTALYYAGVPLLQAKYLMGHSNIKMTADVYSHLDAANFENPYPVQSKVIHECFTVNLRLIGQNPTASAASQ